MTAVYIYIHVNFLILAIHGNIYYFNVNFWSFRGLSSSSEHMMRQVLMHHTLPWKVLVSNIGWHTICFHLQWIWEVPWGRPCSHTFLFTKHNHPLISSNSLETDIQLLNNLWSNQLTASSIPNKIDAGMKGLVKQVGALPWMA